MAKKKEKNVKMKKNNGHKKKIVKHLKEDVKTFNKEAKEDKKLIKKLSKKKNAPKKKDGNKKTKVQVVMHEFKEGQLKSGSKKGPKVKSRKQAVAIALSEAGKSKKKRT